MYRFIKIVCVTKPGKIYVKAPVKKKNAEELPKWLKIPFVVNDTETELQLCTEKCCANEKIEPGHGLYDENNGPLGTVGPVMASERHGKPSINVIITAGHVIPELAKEIYASVEKRKIKSDVSVTSQRTNEGRLVRPLGPPWADEVGFLIINPADSMMFNGKIANLNCHLLRDELITQREMRDPLAFSRLEFLRMCIETSPPLVFKRGVSTDLTMGRLVEISHNMPDGRWTRGTHDREIDDDEWLGFVEWLPGIPFTASGDSGSLVYAVENGVVVPLGIHVGSPTTRHGQSCFICLETFCLEAENEG